MRPTLLCWLFLVALIFAPKLALADEIRLTGGRALKGTVVSDDDDGVKIKLASGEVREVPRGEVVRVTYDEDVAAAPSVAPAEGAGVKAKNTGTLVVVARPAATIEVDGEPVAAQPDGEGKPETSTRQEVAAGQHLVVARFEDGSTQEESVVVRAGKQTLVELSRSALREFERYRGGSHLFFGGGAGVAQSFGGGGGDSGFGAELVIQWGVSLSPGVDFRIGGIGNVANGATYEVIYVDDSRGSTFEPLVLVTGRAAADLRFNFVSVYGMWVGFAGGAGTEGPVVGPRWSLLDFRVGSERQIEISMPQELLFAELPVYSQTLNVGYVLAL